MASIFTFDPDPPKVSSPWSMPQTSSHPPHGGQDDVASTPSGISTPSGQPGLLSEYGVVKLEAEPQEGPTEYKLHLLLRPRRAYKSMTTIKQASRSSHGHMPEATGSADTPLISSSPAPTQSRQQRLLHLTTQLLWRLQQSSPYHASSSKEMPLPRLPGGNIGTDNPKPPESLAPALEESRGALYEIGVSDDGTLVGLTKDEMDESIKTLKTMATSLGCVVEVLRMVIVGDCEWVESGSSGSDSDPAIADIPRQGKLWVAEAFVTPNLGLSDGRMQSQDTSREPSSGTHMLGNLEQIPIPSRGHSQTSQLRVTFTGPTMSGKSSLLGTLSTGTLDNGRGKSRLSLLKHRHEVLSGVTSSIAQELIGYKNKSIINFSQANIESWIDIHDHTEDGRLVFVSDCGGHPRYRRTVLRGLLNWAPHWSVLCLAADDADAAANRLSASPGNLEAGRTASPVVDLAEAHLKLSLKLDVPMAIVITKLDITSKASLQKTMSKILTAVKDAGRTPKIIQPDSKQHDVLHQIPLGDWEKIQDVCKLIAQSGNLNQHVPIILTSTVKGTGIGLLHALLEGLPLPPAPTPHDFVGMALNPEQPKCLFHIDDTFSLPSSYSALANGPGAQAAHGLVASGYLRFGSLSVGDEIVIGPFPPADVESYSTAPEERGSPGSHGLSISHPASAELERIAMKNAISASSIPGEWHSAQIVSIRNLRLPVRSLEAGQAGSIGLLIKASNTSRSGELDTDDAVSPRVRRGMVIAIPSRHMLDTGLKLQAASGFSANFLDLGFNPPTVGSLVNVYVASVRAAARVRKVRHHYEEVNDNMCRRDSEETDGVFGFGEDTEQIGRSLRQTTHTPIEIFLDLLHSREWIELGSRVMLLEGGSQYSSGLEGFVGKVVEIWD